VTLGVALTGCSDHGDPVPSATASVTPSAVVSTPPPSQGPPAVGSVPAAAFVSTDDLGPGWAPATALATPCAARYARTAIRSIGLTQERGTLTETVATGTQVEAAVNAWRSSLEACRYDVEDDPLGDAGLIARSPDGQDAIVVTGTEGVLVVVHAHGELANATDELDGWADLALGTSCVAAPDGCH
jgi:hypothetical protein